METIDTQLFITYEHLEGKKVFEKWTNWNEKKVEQNFVYSGEVWTHDSSIEYITVNQLHQVKIVRNLNAISTPTNNNDTLFLVSRKPFLT